MMTTLAKVSRIRYRIAIMENHAYARGKKVFTGLSGGVDSAVSAALLQRAGADVTGVFIKGWYPPGMPCTWAADRRDAMRVAAHLGIPFHTLDASEEYKRGVIDYLLAEYAAGRTPNPDIMCNREVKFGAFYNFAREHGADFIATGHYAQSIRGTSHSANESDNTSDAHLRRGIDESKDQSYFLWAIPPVALARTIFPVGSMSKSDVRVLAEKFDLPVAEKKDSQGICFLGSISVADFLRNELGSVAGDAVDQAGKLVGRHDGAALYTLGERIALQEAASGPWYVIEKDMDTNRIVVARVRNAGQQQSLQSTEIKLRETNWFDPLRLDESLEAQYRYHGPRISGTFDTERNIFVPNESLSEPIASGQSLVLYAGDECIGGGIIV
jgi:tRNA-specific 2-thiouridylase